MANNPISILIVEDEIDLLNRLAKYVSIFCDTVYQATNGLEALEIYKKHRPNIILTDINMPKLGGIELVEEVRKMDKNIQLIILSAHANTEDFLKVIPLDLVSYLIKPIKMEQLKKVILQSIDNISDSHRIRLNDGYMWDKNMRTLLKENRKIELSNYEKRFIEILILKINQDVSYEDLHNHIYNLEEYSQNTIFTLAKRVRKKTTKELIKSSFKFGYFMESV